MHTTLQLFTLMGPTFKLAASLLNLWESLGSNPRSRIFSVLIQGNGPREQLHALRASSLTGDDVAMVLVVDSFWPS